MANLESKLTFSESSFKTGWFLHALSTWVHGRGLRPLQAPVPLPAACGVQRVNGNDLSCLFNDGFNSFINNASSIFLFLRLP